MIRKLRQRLCEVLFEDRWELGFVENSLEDVMSQVTPLRINWLKNPYNDRWFADPFILDVNSKTITLLVEEFEYKKRKGVIARLIIDRENNTLIDRQLVLELDTHLSFPFIHEEADGIYIYPENGASGRWTRYRYEGGKCAMAGVVQNEPLTDAIIPDVLDKNMIVSTRLPDANGRTLCVYEKTADGYKQKQQVRFDSNVSRNAGSWFRFKGDVYRPAQDCNVTYGGGVIIQRVAETETGLSFSDVRRIDSGSNKYSFGCHTFNFKDDCIVVDAHGYRYYKLMRFLGKAK